MATEEQQHAPEKPLFRDIDADDEAEQMAMESLCMQCHEDGMTRLLLTRIPHFKEVVISSFECPHCGYSNQEVQSAGEIQEMGCKWTLDVKTEEDLGRQLVKSDVASVRIPELDFEIPSRSQPGVLTTVEGLLQRAIDGLQQQQIVRRALDAALADSIDVFIGRLEKVKGGSENFQLLLEDTTGNSCVEYLNPPAPDPQLTQSKFARTPQQNAELGLASAETVAEVPDKKEDVSSTSGSAAAGLSDGGAFDSDEILTFHTNCPSCQSPVVSLMKPVAIPHFKQVIVMGLKCERCGFSSNEVKSAGGVEARGLRIVLTMTEEADLSRDVLVAETATLEIPEIEVEVQSFASSGHFTTVEGVLQTLKKQLIEMHSLSLGDSADGSKATVLQSILRKIDEAVDGKRFVTMMIDDPAGNSYMQNVMAPDPDPNLVCTHYDRTAEQDEDLGVTALREYEKNAGKSS